MSDDPSITQLPKSCVRCRLVSSPRRSWPASLPTSATVRRVAAASIRRPPPIRCWRGSSKALPKVKTRSSSRPSVARRFAPGPGAFDRCSRAANRSGSTECDSSRPQAGRGLRHPGRGRTRRHGGGVQGAAPGPQRLAALKMVLAGEFASPAQELRFRLEAELAARVQHPNIVQVYEIGSYEGRPFLGPRVGRGGQPGEPARRQALASARGGLAHRDAGPCHPRGTRRRSRPPRPEAGEHPAAAG